MSVPPISILGIPVEGEFTKGDRVADRIAGACEAEGISLLDGDVVVVTHKIVSKAEGRVARMEAGDWEARDALIEREGATFLRRNRSIAITRTSHGFVCASAGIDASNVEPGTVTLLPRDPDRSARSIRSRLRVLTGADVAVVISDTFGRAWRNGQTNVAIGVAGMLATINYRDTVDTYGTVLKVTNIAIADELAGAAEMVMGKAEGVPVAVVRGAPIRRGRGSVAAELVRPAHEDLFL
ncbi:MAG TPA: coenzyme F420-0:L-glutamate ligase [Actinomycetota bacterium]|nr:coenzyme F420-0:L-glutamate ligase [Actinomycetota bacterium]